MALIHTIFSVIPAGIVRGTSSSQFGSSAMYRCGTTNNWVEFSSTNIWIVTPSEYEEVSIRLIKDTN